MHAGVIGRIGDTSGQHVTVVVGVPGHPAMVAPSQTEIDAARAQRAASQAGVTFDVVAHAPHDGATPLPTARLDAPQLDTPSE